MLVLVEQLYELWHMKTTLPLGSLTAFTTCQRFPHSQGI